MNFSSQETDGSNKSRRSSDTLLETSGRWVGKAWKSLLSGSDDDNVLSLRADTSLRSIKLIDLELIHPKVWYSMFGTQIMIKQTKGGPK